MSTTHTKAMQVPDRIILTGFNHHVGTTALPRELQLENIVMPPDPEHIRILTPPRSITLHDTPNNGLNSGFQPKSLETDDETLIVEDNEARFLPNGRLNTSVHDASLVSKNHGYYESSDDVGIEMEHLREQMGRITNRLIAVEEEIAASKERENYLMIGALVYITIHACAWLFKSNR